MGSYTIEEVKYITPTILGISLIQAELQRPISFLPGQYAGISFKKGRRKSAVRCFSIASSPIDPERIEFGIRVAGKFTKALTKLKPGAQFDVLGPFGNFVFEPLVHKQIVLCAGGIGITPFMSMIRYATQAQLSNKISLIISARNANEIPYYTELQGLVRSNLHLNITYVVSGQELPQVGNRQKAIISQITTGILREASSNMRTPTYFVCGPPSFMDAVIKMLADQSVPKENVITESFAQGKALKSGNSLDWPSTMYVASAIGALILTAGIAVNELLKNITPSLLPDSLTTDEQKAFSGRQKELDTLVNDLQASTAVINKSPAVIAAEKEVADAQILLFGNISAPAVTNAQPATNTANQTQATNQPSQATPPPVCTTSASGITTCQ